MMKMSPVDYVVGTVKEIRGTTVIVRMFENSNQMYYFFHGQRYTGIVIGSFIGIRRNDYIIVGKIEKEFAFDTLSDPSVREFRKDRFVREIEVKILGSIYDGKYTMGMSTFPQLFNDVILLSDTQKKLIVNYNDNDSNNGGDVGAHNITIGKIWPDGMNFNLRFLDFFNTHVAIFGNTGSGKSNTLAKLYHELLNYREGEKTLNFSKSKFLLIDFNGEYIGENCISKDKEIIKLNTRKEEDRYTIFKNDFWSKDMLSVLFSATEQTQQPFINRTINYYFKNNENFKDNISLYVSQAFADVYSVPNKHGLDLLKRVIEILGLENENVSSWIDKTIFNVTSESFYSKDKIEGWDQGKRNSQMSYWNAEEEILNHEKKEVKKGIDRNSSCYQQTINDPIVQLQIACYLQIIFELRYNIAQYDHIAPLLGRIDSRIGDFTKVFEIIDDNENNTSKRFTVVSLKNVNQDMKLLIPLIIAKSTYDKHKYSHENNYFNLIIDEAHNILSERSKRESEKWKDYRLEVFEEVIKEGRKFGYFLTISSQRPSDISETIVSQVHNYIIHRLVNDNDLRILDNTLTSLDRISKDGIPNLSPGQAILTGTLFELPMIVKIDILPKEIGPKSENISLKDEWLSS